MTKITFDTELDGRKRKATIKDKVNGYKHTEANKIHFFQRGKIAFIINSNTEAVELRKFDYGNACYKNVTYDDFHKFIDIGKIEKVQ